MNLFSQSLRKSLLLLVLSIIIPLVIALTISGLKNMKLARRNAEQNAERVLNSVISQQKYIEQSTYLTLRLISLLPEVNEEDNDKINRICKLIIEKDPSFTSVFKGNAQGKLIAGFPASSKVVDINDRKYYQTAKRTGKFATGEFAQSRLAGANVFHYGYPVTDEHLTIKYILGIGFNLNYYNDIFSTLDIEPSSLLVITDANGVRLFSSIPQRFRVGQKESAEKLNQISFSRTSFFTATDTDNIKRFYVCAPIKSSILNETYMNVFVGIPTEIAYREVVVETRKNIIIWIFAIVIVVLIALYYSRRYILKYIDNLSDAASKFAHGNLTIRSGFKSYDGEIGSLAAAFDEMAERLDLALSSGQIGIWDWKIESGELFWDKTMFDLYHVDYKTYKITLDNWRQLIHPDDLELFDERIHRIIEFKTKFGIEVRVESPGGVRFIRIFANVICNDKHIPFRIIGVSWDITERKEMENKLIEALNVAQNSDRLKSAFLANMSHEIRTPMNAIVGFANLIKDPELNPDERNQFADVITTRSNDLLHIINDILDVARIESKNVNLQNKIFSINDLVDEVKNIYNDQAVLHSKEIHIITETPLEYSASFILADQTKLKQIFTNLIDNALKFTEHGEIRFGYNLPDNDSFTCFVCDTGIGIAPHQQSIIFDRFAQAERNNGKLYGGTGLGLAICKGNAELMGGRIWVESEPGKGSCFKVSLPHISTAEKHDSGNTKRNSIMPNWPNKRILVVEDDTYNYLFLKEVLKKTNAQLEFAPNGIEARKWFDRLGELDLVLLDIRLPDVDGFTLCKEIRMRNKHIIVIAQTAYSRESDRQKSIEAGFDEFVTKPINQQKLLQVISSFWEKDRLV